MGRIKSMAQATAPARVSNRWDGTHGGYLAGRSHIDGVDVMAIEMERYWGCDRLRLLVSPDMREKFDRQRYKLQAAIQRGTLEDVRHESERMIMAWKTLNDLALLNGAKPRSAEVWEVSLSDGSVALIVSDAEFVTPRMGEGRQTAVYTLDEIAKLIELNRGVIQAKLTWPGATVTAVRRQVQDPLDGLEPLGFDVSMDDDIPEMT